MAGFIYYLPKHSAPVNRLEDIPTKCKLDRVLNDAELTYEATTKGPDDGPGILFAIKGRQKPHCVKGDERARLQSWTHVLESEGGAITHWIGWDRDDRPKPEDLSRGTYIHGDSVKLGDGNHWTIPVVYSQGTTLPRTFEYHGGELYLKHRKEFDHIARQADQWIELLLQIKEGVHDGGFKPIDLIQYIADLLSINYHVGPVECTCETDLITCDKELFYGVLMASFGWTQNMEVAANE